MLFSKAVELCNSRSAQVLDIEIVVWCKSSMFQTFKATGLLLYQSKHDLLLYEMTDDVSWTLYYIFKGCIQGEKPTRVFQRRLRSKEPSRFLKNY